MSTQIPIPPLIQLPNDSQGRMNEGKDDLFATLFSPPTPRPSPTLTPVLGDTPDTLTQSYCHRARTQSVDSDFGAFVSVPSSDDPLRSSGSNPDFLPFTPIQNIDFLGNVAVNAIQATERNKQDLLEELLNHEDDPLYFLQTSASASASRTSTPIPPSDPDSAESLHLSAEQPPCQSSDSSEESERHSPRPTSSRKYMKDRSRGRSSSPPLRSPSLPPSSPTRISKPEIQPAQSFFIPSSFPSRWVSSFLSSAARSPPPRRAASEAERHDQSDSSSSSSSSSRIHQRTLPATLPSQLVDTLSGLPPSLPVRVPQMVPGIDAITHGTPFASHAFVPASGAPGFAGDRDWDKGFDFDRSNLDKKSVRLVGRKDITIPVLTVELADMLRPHFPALARLPRSWLLLYSLDQNGISLNTLYMRCQNHTGGALVILRDSRNAVFGAWMGEGIHLSKGAYFGSGESFLWKRIPDNQLKIYKWSGKNDYVALCESDYMSFGGGDGHYGLYIESSLTDGSSATCPTFNNEPLCAAGPRQGDNVLFECVGLEVWGVG